jgi:hypothetical protein
MSDPGDALSDMFALWVENGISVRLLESHKDVEHFQLTTVLLSTAKQQFKIDICSPNNHQRGVRQQAHDSIRLP